MKTTTVIFCSLCTASLAFAGPELERLRTAYKAATLEASEPCKFTYVKELQKLSQRLTKQGKISDIPEIDSEFRTLGMQPVERFFWGTIWRTPVGTSFRFDSKGRGQRVFGGERSIPFVWTARKDGVVEIANESAVGAGELTTWFFRFVSDTEGYFGKSEKDISIKIQRQP